MYTTLEVNSTSALGWPYFLTSFVCLQAGLVMLQDIFGPAFFLPKSVSLLFFPFHDVSAQTLSV